VANPKGNKSGKGKKGRRNKFGSPLYNPTELVSGRPLAKLARAITRIETQPAIRAKRFQMGQSGRAQARDVQALEKMGTRLRGEVTGVANKLGQYGEQNLAAQQQANALAQQRLAANSQASTDRLNQLQSGVLGQQISALASQKTAGGSSAASLARLAAQQQGTAEASNQSWGNMAAAAAANSERQAINFGAAQQNEAANQQVGIARSIATRVGDTRAAGAEERRALRNELGTLKSTKGATLIKNLMALRREQQQYGNERAQTLATLQQNRAENALDWAGLNLDREKEANDQNDGGGSSGGSSGGRPDSLSISPEEWKNWKTAADDYRDGGGVQNWNAFMKGLEEQPGVSFTPIERKKFKRKYRKYVRAKNN
jgi:hypothetical protein